MLHLPAEGEDCNWDVDGESTRPTWQVDDNNAGNPAYRNLQSNENNIQNRQSIESK